MKRTSKAMILTGAIILCCMSTIALGQESSSSKKVTVVQVGMDGSTKPFNYTDSKNTLVGFEVDILKEIDSRLDDITFKFNITEWDALFASLDAGRYDMLCNNITWKKEREEKYLFSSQYYFKNHTILITAQGKKGINTIDDLQGKRVEVESGTATTLFLEKYNTLHKDNPIKLVYTDASTGAMISNVSTGRYPAAIFASTYIDVIEKDLGLKFDRHTIPNENEIQSSEAYFLFRKNEKDLDKKISSTLKEMKDDGTLSKLSIKYFGEDYTK